MARDNGVVPQVLGSMCVLAMGGGCCFLKCVLLNLCQCAHHSPQRTAAEGNHRSLMQPVPQRKVLKEQKETAPELDMKGSGGSSPIFVELLCKHSWENGVSPTLHAFPRPYPCRVSFRQPAPSAWPPIGFSSQPTSESAVGCTTLALWQSLGQLLSWETLCCPPWPFFFFFHFVFVTGNLTGLTVHLAG